MMNVFAVHSMAMTVLPPQTTIIEPLSISLELNDDKYKQGEFIIAHIKGAPSAPRIWFNTMEFHPYLIELENKIEDANIPSPPPVKIYRALIPVENMTKPGPYSVLARLGTWEQRIPIEIKDNGKGISRIKLPPDKEEITPTAFELSKIGPGLGYLTSTKLWQGKFMYPAKAPKSSPFGVKRSYNGGPVDSYHKGLDFAGRHGDPVYAPADGTVIVAGLEKDGFRLHGSTIILDHGQAVTSIYMHLSKIDVKEGDKVIKGQKIGEIGHTGISTGPHLHWGVYIHGTSVEPELFVKDEIL
jgi:murein DD-endopeptidase MepM/ murein hydrolase activator NlpD